MAVVKLCLYMFLNHGKHYYIIIHQEWVDFCQDDDDDDALDSSTVIIFVSLNTRYVCVCVFK